MEGTPATTTPATNGAAAPAPAEPQIELDDEAKALQLEANKAESRKKIAEAENASAEAQKGTLKTALPDVDIEPLKGDVEVGEGVGLISDRIAYSLVDEAAAEVAADVKRSLKDVSEARVLVVDDRDLVSSDWAYELVRIQLGEAIDALTAAKALVQAGGMPSAPPAGEGDEEFEIVLTDGGGADLEAAAESGAGVSYLLPALPAAAAANALIGPSALVGAAADIAGFFRSDYSLSTKAVDLKTTPLTAAICKRLEAHVPTEVDRFLRLDEGGVLGRFKHALGLRQEVNRLSSVLKATVVDPTRRDIEGLRAALSEVGKSWNEAKEQKQRTALKRREREIKGEIRKAENRIASQAGATATADSLVAAVDQLMEKLTKAPKGGGLTPLAVAAIRERLHRGDHPYTHVLYASVESPGGEAIKRVSRIPGRSVMTFMGGAQVSYLLVDLESDTVKAAGTESLLGTAGLKLGSARVNPMSRVDLKGRRTSHKSPLVTLWRDWRASRKE